MAGSIDGTSTERLTGGLFSSCECSHSLLCINVIASSMDKSRCPPGPPRATRRRSAIAPYAAQAAPMYSPRSPPIEIGGPAGSPRKPVSPESACRVNSVAGRSDQGPVQPKSEMVTTTQSGRASSSRAGSMPCAVAAGPGAGHDHDVGGGQQILGNAL